MGETKRRRAEGHDKYVARDAKATQAANETSRAAREDAHAPWRAAWEKRSGKKYGVGTHAEYTAWLDQVRKDRGSKSPAKAAAGVSAQDAGDAIARDEAKKKKDE